MKRLLHSLLIIASLTRADENPYLKGNPPQGEVSLPLQDWQTVWKAASQLPAPNEEKAPLPAVVQSATYAARMDGSVLRCDAVFTIRSFTNDWQTLPLAGGEWSLDTSVVPPANVALVRYEEQLSVLLHGVGDVEVKLPLSLEIMDRAASFTLLPAAAQRFTMEPMPDKRVLTLNGRAPALTTKNEWAYVMPSKGGEISAGIEDQHPIAPPEPPKPPVSKATIKSWKANTRLLAEGAILHELNYGFEHCGVFTWRFTLPQGTRLLGCKVNDVETSPIQRTASELEFPLIAKGEAAATTKIQLAYLSKGQAWDRVSGSVTLELPKTDVFAQMLHWQVELAEGYELTASSEGLRITDAVMTSAPERTVAFKKELFADEPPGVELFYKHIEAAQ